MGVNLTHDQLDRLMQNPVAPRKVVAIAHEYPGIEAQKDAHKIADPDLPNYIPAYGDDLSHGVGRRSPNGEDEGDTPEELEPKMRELLDIFAPGECSSFNSKCEGMATRLMEQFLAPQRDVVYFEDRDLNEAAYYHPNIDKFCLTTWGAPTESGGLPPAPGKKGIHQALEDANFDISNLVAPTDLGVPAFNKGKTSWTGKADRAGDLRSGLFLMIDMVQHVYVIARHYFRDADSYYINLEFRLYDVFGLDDDDVTRYGTAAAGGAIEWLQDNINTPGMVTGAHKGIVAWWQLQHQHNYVPLITRVRFLKRFSGPLS
jgi:hypothetical protein